jgi:hypothetical protein
MVGASLLQMVMVRPRGLADDRVLRRHRPAFRAVEDAEEVADPSADEPSFSPENGRRIYAALDDLAMEHGEV